MLHSAEIGYSLGDFTSLAFLKERSSKTKGRKIEKFVIMANLNAIPVKRKRGINGECKLSASKIVV